MSGFSLGEGPCPQVFPNFRRTHVFYSNDRGFACEWQKVASINKKHLWGGEVLSNIKKITYGSGLCGIKTEMRYVLLTKWQYRLRGIILACAWRSSKIKLQNEWNHRGWSSIKVMMFLVFATTFLMVPNCTKLYSLIQCENLLKLLKGVWKSVNPLLLPSSSFWRDL
jgi:hypothetical protein